MPTMSLSASCNEAEAEAFLRERADVLPPGLMERIAREGYAVVPGMLGAEQVAALRARVEELCEEEGATGFRENHAQSAKIGHGMLADLVNKGEVFDGIWDHPLVVGVGHRLVQGSMRLFCLNYRGTRPGAGSLPFHSDQPWTAPGAPAIKFQCIIPLVDFTSENGATRFVPGSHLRLQEEVHAEIGGDGRHPDEIVVAAPAGSFILYHGGCFHRAAENTTSAPRHALILAYIPHTLPQLCDQARYLRLSTAQRLDGFQRWLLDT
jgi:ectoine hydroxylase-related dioxygenase (phytanoyl-CoA dioxygenase family)